MNKSSKTNQQLLLEIEELRARLAVAHQRLQEANERMQAEMTERKGTEQVLGERLKFETLLAEISAHFVNLPADQIDSEVGDAQRRICEFLDLDRSSLWQVSEKEPGALLLTHIYQPQGAPPIPERPNAWDFFPWTAQKGLAGETVTVTKMSDLPPEAGRDRESYGLYGTKSVVAVPLSVGGGPIFGLLTFVVMQEERGWPETFLMGFKLIAQVFANGLARKQAEEALGERLQFEQLLSGLSARFVNIPPDRVDSEIEEGLRQILEFFQVDRCALLRTLPGKTSWQITHVASSNDVPPVPAGVELPRSINPWAYEKLVEKHEVLSFSRLDDLPAEANVDRQTWTEWGIRSNVNIPILIGEPVDHIFAINSVKSERVWPEELFPRLRLLGEIFVNALERKQIRLEIEERLRFESLISNLSAGFVNLAPDEVASEINKGLCSIVEFFDADRCSIGLFSEDRTQLALAFEYRRADAEPAPGSFSKEQMPWYMEQLIRGNPVVINRVEDSPPEAEKERQLCLAKGMKSLLAIPMLSEGKTLGSFALVSTRAERVWSEELVRRLRLVSEVFANILERRRAEAEAFHARKELMYLERLSRMGELTASLAHELNQPLTSILTNARAALRFIQSGRLDIDELKEILQDIANDDKRAGDIIRNLRAMVKPDEGEQEPVLINDVLRETISLFNSEAIIRNLTLEMDFADSLPLVNGNKVQIQQVLVNLMMNAAESMMHEASGTRKIVLQSRVVDHDAVQVALRDFGPGVEEKELNRIFEPFFTTKRSGLGMGLSLSRSIIEAHGGHIWVKNNPDKGATFYFDLPAISKKVIGHQ